MKLTRHQITVVTDGEGWSFQTHTALFDDQLDADQDETTFMRWGYRAELNAALDCARDDALLAQLLQEIAARHP